MVQESSEGESELSDSFNTAEAEECLEELKTERQAEERKEPEQ